MNTTTYNNDTTAEHRNNLLLALAAAVTIAAGVWFVTTGISGPPAEVPRICHVETMANGQQRLVNPQAATEDCIMMPVSGWSNDGL